MFRWRRPYHDWRVWMYYPMVLTTLALAIYSVTPAGRPDGGVWLMPTVSGMFALMLWRVVRTGIYLSGDFVRIQRLYSSKTLRWDGITEIGDYLTPGFGLTIQFRTYGGAIVDSGVQRMDASMDSYAPMLPRRTYARLMEQLRQLHQEAIAPGRPGPPAA